MPVNPYDDRKVSLRRPHGNGDLDIVRASYTRRKANVTEALQITKRKKRKRRFRSKMLLFSLYLLDIFNTSKTGPASKCLTLSVFVLIISAKRNFKKKLYAFLRRPYNKQVQFLP